jgi:hypothetical protein
MNDEDVIRTGFHAHIGERIHLHGKILFDIKIAAFMDFFT